jgi:formate dehydrogenase subunit beta
MEVHFMKIRMIPTHNDPLGTVRKILTTLWEKNNLERVLLPLNGNAEEPGPKIVKDKEQINRFNPFTPLMPINSAQLIPELIHNEGPVAAVLRPCELRTLDGMIRLNQLNTENLITICVDCLGTLPSDEFEWRAQRKGSPKGLTQEALQFARQGGIVPYRYRAACQICESPQASQANLNIAVLGLPVRQNIIIKTQSNDSTQQLLQDVTIPLDKDLLTQHHRVIARLSERGQNTRQRIFAGLVGVLPNNIDSLMEPLRGCADCRICFDNCPMCTSEYPRKDPSGEFNRRDVINWLVSCSECGICEQSCPKHLPLTIIFGYIRDQLQEMREEKTNGGT